MVAEDGFTGADGLTGEDRFTGAMGVPAPWDATESKAEGTIQTTRVQSILSQHAPPEPEG